MRLKFTILTICLFLGINASVAQSACTALGQNPSTAFPVCGSNVFSQAVVPICGISTIPDNCANIVLTDKNPFWYKFKCYTQGTLGFLITPLNLGDDYDWQIFDVTNHNPNDVYTDPTLKVSYNWSGESGLTGASQAGTQLFVCAGFGQPLFSKMPMLILGHDYLLLISHFSDSQSGYNLSFGGGTAQITDTIPPGLKSAVASCDAMHVLVTLNKKMKCSSLDPGASEFSISPASGTIISAVGNACNVGFDFDSILLTFGAPLPNNTYTLAINNGIDGNTILDICDNAIPQGQTRTFNITPYQPTPLDSISPVGCSPSILHLVFNRPILCNTIANDGSDFKITGPSQVTVRAATAACNSNGLTSVIDLQLANPIVLGGTYQLKLVQGSDSNTIFNECGLPTLPGSQLNFIVADTVSATLSFRQVNGCHTDTLYFLGNNSNGINSWKWTRDNFIVSNIQNPIIVFAASGQHIIRLSVSNTGCTDSASQALVFDNEVKAKFESSDIICPEDSAIFKNTTSGLVNSWLWNFGDGTSSIDQNPGFHKYPVSRVETNYTVKLTASNASCQDVVSVKLRVLPNCYIAVPNAFTPNGDGLNDYLYPLNAFKALDLDFKIYNRWGKLMFATSDWTKKWNGTVGGDPQGAGAYVWTLSYKHRDTGVRHISKGTTMLIR